jgi:peptidoglycan/xylan/chitin deacetylase (PgdA/CDA1 family)
LVAYPILRKHNVPATFFVSTDFVEHNQPIWFEIVAYAFLNLPVNTIQHPLCESAAPSQADRTVRLAELNRVMRKLKGAPDADRTAFVEHLKSLVDASVLQTAWTKFGGAMRWEHVAEVARNNIEIGSHTVSHPILSKTEGQVTVNELADSKRVLESKVGSSVELLAYPVGGRSHFSADVIRVAKNVGYTHGISYIAGVNRPASLDPVCVYRHTVERNCVYRECLPDAPLRQVPAGAQHHVPSIALRRCASRLQWRRDQRAHSRIATRLDTLKSASRRVRPTSWHVRTP